MKIITNPLLDECLQYPIGHFITVNKEKIQQMINSFLNIKEFKKRKINLICTGSSGAIIATIFSLNIPNENKIVHVKKEGEKAHVSSIDIYSGEVNVIVDDFMVTGDTLNKIYAAIKYKLNSGKGFVQLNVDCLCITGEFEAKAITFTPDYVICGKVKKE